MKNCIQFLQSGLLPTCMHWQHNRRGIFDVSFALGLQSALCIIISMVSPNIFVTANMNCHMANSRILIHILLKYRALEFWIRVVPTFNVHMNNDFTGVTSKVHVTHGKDKSALPIQFSTFAEK